jgi:hypothetical protein
MGSVAHILPTLVSSFLVVILRWFPEPHAFRDSAKGHLGLLALLILSYVTFTIIFSRLTLFRIFLFATHACTIMTCSSDTFLTAQPLLLVSNGRLFELSFSPQDDGATKQVLSTDALSSPPSPPSFLATTRRTIAWAPETPHSMHSHRSYRSTEEITPFAKAGDGQPSTRYQYLFPFNSQRWMVATSFVQ